MTTATRPAPASSIIDEPAASRQPVDRDTADRASADRATANRATADRRLAALVDDLARRDDAASAEREARRPIVWLTAMTVSAVVLAQVAILVAVARPF
jgi:hypothetical protein